MKKIIVILAAALIGTTAVYSQDEQTKSVGSNTDYAKHRLHIYGSMGYANNIYDRVNKSFIYDNYSFSSAFEMKYAFFFAPKWGFSVGAGVSRYDAKGTLNIEGIIPDYNDNKFPVIDPTERYDLHYKTNNLVEKQLIYALEAPIQFHFEHRVGKNGIFASLGATGYFPIILAQSTYPKGGGTLTTAGYNAFENAFYTDPPHFGEREARVTPAKVKMNFWSVDAVAEFGGIFRINHKCDFYLGAYGSYGFINILPKEKVDFIAPEQNNSFAVNSLLASNFLGEYNKYVETNNLGWKKADEKWNRWQVGAKIGFHIKPGAVDKKREWKKTNRNNNNNDRSVVVVRDTVHIVNVYNMNNLTDQNNFTQSEQESINMLADVLGKGKILFDFDSDVPKISDKSFISAAAVILQKEPSLRLMIEGYTCEMGSEKHNRELAARRANAIRDLFIKQGVKSSQIEVAAYTANDPQSKQNIITGSLKDHRVVIFRIIKK